MHKHTAGHLSWIDYSSATVTFGLLYKNLISQRMMLSFVLTSFTFVVFVPKVSDLQTRLGGQQIEESPIAEWEDTRQMSRRPVGAVGLVG